MSLADDTIYIAETGDNARAYTNYRIYKFAEPSMNTDTVSTSIILMVHTMQKLCWLTSQKIFSSLLKAATLQKFTSLLILTIQTIPLV